MARRTVAMPFVLAFAGYVLVTVVVLRDVVRHLLSRVPHDLGDPLLSAALLWWNAHVLPLTERWWNGFAFWPSPGMLAFSDHRLGETLIAAPLEWIGLGSVAVYNVTLLAMFPLSAIAAHWLAYTLTRRHDVAVIAGLAYGFSPFRFGHVEHLELQASYGIPAALATLHLYLRERRPVWLVAFAAAVVVQGLSCSYYVVHLGVFVALWLLWYTRRDTIAAAVGVAAALGAAALVLSPIAWPYVRIHRHYGFVRSFNDIITLSADASSFVTAPPLVALWRWTSSLNDTERQLFPGATILILILIGLVLALRSEPARRRGNRLAWICAGLAMVAAAVAASAAFFGPWQLHLGGLRVSVGTPFKPLSLTILLLAIALFASAPLRNAYARQSPLAFYVLTAVFMAACCLGPKPRLLGYQFLYQPPYSWLMHIGPIGESMRVPARFGMPFVLALAIGGALAFARLTARRSSLAAVVIVSVAVVADGWPAGLEMLEPPEDWPQQISALRPAAFMELPLGESVWDTDAMFRGLQMHTPVVNGYSGFQPSYYAATAVAMAEHDDSALEAFTAEGPLLVLVDRRWNWSIEALAWMNAYPHARPVLDDGDRHWFMVDIPTSPMQRCGGAALPIAAAADRTGTVDVKLLTDGSSQTAWTTGTRQQRGDEITFDLGRVETPCSIVLSFGSRVAVHPRRLTVATSTDGSAWNAAFDGGTAGQAIRSQIERPRDAAIEIPLGGIPTRFVRCRLAADNPNFPWVVTDVVVTGTADR